ncbi:RAxF-45 family protein [Neobacillus vireti]|nr:RAxF-45 family protein [Neobacillus vireti]
MKRSIFARLQWLEALTIYRAIFHDEVLKGGSLPFFRNFNVNIER